MTGLKTRLLLGTRHVDEYLCCGPFDGFRARVGSVDVTDTHLFLGYRGAIGQRLLDALAPRSGPIQLDHAAYAQLRVAYAIARAIRVVTVAAPDGVNRFPTDLHGPVGADGYVISLRVGSRAGEQV